MSSAVESKESLGKSTGGAAEESATPGDTVEEGETGEGDRADDDENADGIETVDEDAHESVAGV